MLAIYFFRLNQPKSLLSPTRLSFLHSNRPSLSLYNYNQFPSNFYSTPTKPKKSLSSANLPSTPDRYVIPNQQQLADSSKDGFLNKIKEMFHFYKTGVSMIFTNRKQAKQYIQKGAKEPLTRAETRFIRKAQNDISTLAPFGILLLILPESIPFLVIFAPQFIPSTCVTPEQMLKKRVKVQEQRDKITEIVTANARADPKLLNTKDFKPVTTAIQTVQAYHELFQLNSVAKAPLQSYCRFMGLSTWGTTYLLKNRLCKHINYLRTDDKLLSQEGLAHLSLAELVEANEERGMRTADLTSAQLRISLESWIALTLLEEPKTPELLLVLSRILTNEKPSSK